MDLKLKTILPHVLMIIALLACLLIYFQFIKRKKNFINLNIANDSDVILLKIRLVTIVSFFAFLFVDFYETFFVKTIANLQIFTIVKLIAFIFAILYSFYKHANYKLLSLIFKTGFLTLLFTELYRLYTNDFLPLNAVEFSLLFIFALLVFNEISSYIIVTVLLVFGSLYLADISNALYIHKVVYFSCLIQVIVLTFLIFYIEQYKYKKLVFANHVLKDSSLYIIITNTKNQCMYINNSISNFTRYNLEEVVNKSIFDFGFFTKSDFEKLDRFFKDDIKKIKQKRKTTALINKKGDINYITWDLKLIENNQILWIGKNETQEHQLKIENELLSLVAKKSSNLIVITDSVGYIEWINPEFERVTKFSMDEAKGKKPGSLLQGPHTDVKTVSIIRENLKKRIPFVVEIINYTKDGLPYWVELQINPVFDDNQNLVKFIAIEKFLDKEIEK